MTISTLTLSYPDFQNNTIIDPDQFDTNNSELVAKVNECVDFLNTSLYTNQTIDTKLNAKTDLLGDHKGTWGGKSATDFTTTTTDLSIYAKTAQSAWVNVSLPTNVSNQPGFVTRYKKDTSGFVHIEVMVTGSGIFANMVLFVLPVGLRPTNIVPASGVSYNITDGVRAMRAQVSSSGQVYLNENAGTGWSSLNVVFQAEQ